MSTLNWGMIQDGGALESLMHAIVHAEEPDAILFGRPGKDSGQDARSADGMVVFQAKFRKGLDMDGAIKIAKEEFEKIKKYRTPGHPNHKHWNNVKRWVMVANLAVNPNDDSKWRNETKPLFKQELIEAQYWGIEALERKLEEHPEIRDGFFGGENRVLVGLREARDLLAAESPGGEFLDKPLRGRQEELRKIREFAESDEKRLLPVTGPAGIGKSRLLYEALCEFSENGWRVLWGLPGGMARSSRWFHLLNGNRKTCVVIDDPDDPGLLRAVVEQLATVEHRDWRVLFACRSERAQALRRYRNHDKVAPTFELEPLDSKSSSNLLKSCLERPHDEPWLHRAHALSGGVPEWLCLIARLANEQHLDQLPETSGEIAEDYVGSCLDKSDPGQKDQAKLLLRWLALWGTLRIEERATRSPEFAFLCEEENLQEKTARDLLQELVGTRLVRNWGVGKRLYAVVPLIVRQAVVANWLWRGEGADSRITSAGDRLVSMLVEDRIPNAESVLRTLAGVELARGSKQQPGSLLEPVFDAMDERARGSAIRDQFRVVTLLEKCGAVDPERSLEVLQAIRNKTTEAVQGKSFPANRTLEHKELLAEIPWVLFQIAEHVRDDPDLAKRFLREFGEYVTLEESGKIQPDAGNGPKRLLERILCESRNSGLYAGPAEKLALEELGKSKESTFARTLLESLLQPLRQSFEWIGKWSLVIKKRSIAPNSAEWNIATRIRAKTFDMLEHSGNTAGRVWLWRILAKAHGSVYFAVAHERMSDEIRSDYQKLLKSDLEKTETILAKPSKNLTLEEAAAAREMWAWHLEHGQDDPLRELAARCEKIHNEKSEFREWRIHEFFRFDKKEVLAPVTRHVAKMIKNATDSDEILRFFDAARCGQALSRCRPARERGFGRRNEDFRLGGRMRAYCRTR